MFAVIIGHCDEPLKNQVEGHEHYDKYDEDRDIVSLMKIIKEMAFGGSDKKYPVRQAVEAWYKLMTLQQGQFESLTVYYKRFKSQVERVEETYGIIAPVKVAEKNPKYVKEKNKTVEKERDRLLAYKFMVGANKYYKPMLKGVEEDFALGNDNYPASVEEALQVMTVYGNHNAFKKEKKVYEERPSLSFVQKSEAWRKRLCFKCNQPGHVAKECPNGQDQSSQGQRTGSSHVQVQEGEEQDLHQYSWMD